MELVERTETSYSRPRKRSIVESSDEHGEEVFKFRILLPNGAITDLTLHGPGEEMFVDEFVDVVRIEFERSAKRTPGIKRKIVWDGDVYLEDLSENKIRKRIHFNRFKSNKLHTLRLFDGAEDTVDTFQNMWDLTPDTDLLSELPAEYTFETALADLIDNSLQAVWSNTLGDRRLVSVAVTDQGISIFDSGPGMDGSDEKSIVKWGKMGSSNHRSSKGLAIGGKPPYLMPLFGMFGYGGPIASMHLGRCALVSSKTKESKKVYTLYLEREALLNNSRSECIWRTDGGIRDPLEDEIQTSPHGSFTKVEIYEPKLRCLEEFQLQCRLKDIYFPYIQCDDLHITGKTTTPIEFQVNDVNLAEIEGGEVAITNLLSCNGPEFVLQLHFYINLDTTSKTTSNQGSGSYRQANARLKCVYFPIVEGKESIDRILEKLEAEGCRILENFDNFCRVSIRRLGRLLPDARWGRLPFMEPRRKVDKGQVLKRCCYRVKCFVETDAGFCPTRSKTDLAHHDPFTTALKNFGNKSLGKDSEAIVKVHKGGKPLSVLQLEKEYQDWIMQMHEQYDQEIDSGEDQPVIVVSPRNKKELGISSDVVRVHQAIRRKGASWKSGQKIKILKGAVGCHKNNIYATLEYILIEGFQGDVGGEARLICRPLGCPDEKGCLLAVNGENASLDIRKSISFPISVIDSGKCQAIDTATWKYQLEKRHEKAPSTIDILNIQQCRQLEIDGALPVGASVSAGLAPPNEIVAVVRPFNFVSSSSSKDLDPKYIVKDDLEMSMEVKCIDGSKDNNECEPVCAERVKPSSRSGLSGLYIFPLGCKFPSLFRKAGIYKFSFSICTGSSCKPLEMQVVVTPCSIPRKWGILCDKQGPFADGKPLTVRVGSSFPHLSIACYDKYYNRMPFESTPEVKVKIMAGGSTLVCVKEMMVDLSINKMTLQVTDMLIESSNLDLIRPQYKATLEICSGDELFPVSVPCQVNPGHPHHLKMTRSPKLENSLIPGHVIDKLILELFDAYDNHVAKGVEVRVEVEGFCFQGRDGWMHKVDDHGCVNLSGLLKVTGGYGTSVHLSVSFGGKILLKEEFQIAKRELRMVSQVPSHCIAASQLENIVFEVFDSEGRVDEGIHDEPTHDQFHALTLTSESSQIDSTIRYTFRRGKCTVPSIPVPREEGDFQFVASHSHHPVLRTSVKILVIRAPKLELATLTEPSTPIVHSQCSDGRMLLLQDTYVFDPKHAHALVASLFEDGKKLDRGLAKVGVQIGSIENKLKLLNDRKTAIAREIYDLEVLMEPLSFSPFDHVMDAKDLVVKRIEGKGDDVVAVFCNLLKTIQIREPEKQYVQDVIGVVALLGTVNSYRLSRIFAEYLGEDYMLAVVCKSNEAVSALEKYVEKGEIDWSCSLHEAASASEKTINGRFRVICLEDIRPYSGDITGNDRQRKLALPVPLLPSGRTPHGFLGYAVNMINLNMNMHITTAAGYGLRETLFYLLFGEVQVYETRADMQEANACIKSGAISLDGGIKRGNGILVVLGNCDPEIRFPVEPEVLRSSQHTLDVVKKITDKKAEMEALSAEILKETNALAKARHKFGKRREQLCKFMEEKAPFIKEVMESRKQLIAEN
ncbi:structural maintenance of chromosomes flexible hinge domain-containing protein GMI1-like isoform X2 [Magnolia sinica]|uniref:structural maintenance of chromosomes flexible hinge domain-containing protein GMI1-like isoform X2 n=1 Tax=Magnolia sinica TaxID=86752 RepID=UPI00265A2FF6|nr:structural maintenance of chromosomes flexible hinge domain-containing protein GMI1-like isoform X2 [Magnolia sinica]